MRVTLRGELFISSDSIDVDDPKELPEELAEPAIKSDQPARSGVGRWLSENADMMAISPRERDVLLLLLRGKSNKEIARLLGLSVGVTKNYVSNILRTAKVKTRAGIMAAVLRSAPPSL